EEILLRKIRRILAEVPHARILDVGCGAGLFFDQLEQFGHVEGVESDQAAAETSSRWQNRIVVGNLDSQYQPSAPFDLILMLDVLEHIPDTRPVVRRAAELLTPAGRLLVTVPAFKALWTAHDDMNHHVTRYSARELRATLTRAGLSIIETRYLFQSLVVPKLLVRATEALAPRPARVPRLGPRRINAVLRAWFRTEHALAGRLPFGGSVLAIAAPGTFEDSRPA